MNEWKLKADTETIVITEVKNNYFTVHTDYWMDSMTNSLWFTSYQMARKYVREEMHIKGRFKKVTK